MSKYNYAIQITFRKHQRGYQKLTIQRKCKTNGTQDDDKQYKTICIGHHYAQANTNNVNNTCTILQTTGSKDEPNIVLCENRYGLHTAELRRKDA